MSVGTLNLIVILLGLGLLAWRGVIAARVAWDAHRRDFRPIEIGGWALLAAVDADRYWWGARLDRMSVPEARELLAKAAQAHGLLSVVNVRCPLCDHEITHVLSVAADGELYVRRQATCAHCDFRVDACRHCTHFRPSTGDVMMFEQRDDFSHGRCSIYRTLESVHTISPLHARRLEAMGYDMLPTGKPIADSYLPLAEFTAFVLNLELLRQNNIPWIDCQRVMLVRLYQKTRSPQAPH
jgi:hypothetical protein